MGMSASQARLIALTARMNDIEYQGQQINQQRTTLSNQVNALYNQLLEMSVPTPPSTSDYTKVQYSGTADASKFTLGNVTPTGKNSTGNNTYSIDFSYKRSGHSVAKNNNTAIMTNTSATLGYKSAANIIKDNDWVQTNTKYQLGNKLTTKPEDPEKDVYLAMDIDTYNSWSNKNDAQGVFDSNGNSLNGKLPTSGTTVYVKCNVADLDTDQFKDVVSKTEQKDDQDKVTSTTYNNLYDITENSTQDYATWLTDNYVSSQNLYYVKDDSSTPIQITTVEQLKSYMGDNFDTSHIFARDTSTNPEKQFTNPNYNAANKTGFSVGDMAVYELGDSEVKAKLQGSYADYLTALKNAFASQYGTNLSDSDIAAKFYIYFSKSESGADVPHFIKKDEMSSLNNESSTVRTYEYDEDGTYTQTDKKDQCQLEFDASTGRINKVGIPDGNGQISWIDVTAETVTDDDAYAEAFNDYNYDKAVYDKKQQEINAKTSIVQQEDKNLELKLTRLDNERNAVNTEIDAVKKVVSDNIEKSYKTFSG